MKLSKTHVWILVLLGLLILSLLLLLFPRDRFSRHRYLAEHGQIKSDQVNGNLLIEKKPRSPCQSPPEAKEKSNQTSKAFSTASTAVDEGPETTPGIGQCHTNKLGMEFTLVQPGSFLMGSPPTETGRDDDEREHRVSISRPFYIQISEVTQGQWIILMGSNPSFFMECGGDCPVENVNWRDIHLFLEKLNSVCADEGFQYRLPTEAEWEYACRAGSTAPFCFGHKESRLDMYAWYSLNSQKKTHPIKMKKPNSWGIYDMHGNVWEWCSDWYGEYPRDDQVDPRGPLSGTYRIIRGGAWNFNAIDIRSAYRNGAGMSRRRNGVGFRLVAHRPDESVRPGPELDRD